MKDRVPTKPNRYAVYDDNHNFLRHEYHERADEPTQEGDPLNSAGLMPDDVATALGLDPADNPQVKNGFSALKNYANTKLKLEKGAYVGTGTYGTNNPNTVTADFEIQILIFIKITIKSSDNSILRYTYDTGDSVAALPIISIPIDNSYHLLETSTNESSSIVLHIKRTNNGKSISWFAGSSSEQQNENEDSSFGFKYKYDYILIGR